MRWVVSNLDTLECGVRQRGLSSTQLFNMDTNQLIGESSITNVGCYLDGVCMNNINYAGGMLLLSPTVGALKKLLAVCETYAVWLHYNATKVS